MEIHGLSVNTMDSASISSYISLQTIQVHSLGVIAASIAGVRTQRLPDFGNTDTKYVNRISNTYLRGTR